MSDDEGYTGRMKWAQWLAFNERYEDACNDLRYAWKIARYTRTGTPRQGDAWERRAQWASACWIAAQRLSGGTRDTQEET